MMMLARWCERADDLCMRSEDRKAAWSQISSLMDVAMVSVDAVRGTLENGGLTLEAPDPAYA